MARLSALYRYPLKSAAAQACDAVDVTPRGLSQDRRWMVVDMSGRALTGRELGRLVLLRADAEGDVLVLDASGTSLRAHPQYAAPRPRVTVWGSTVDAIAADADADAWISRLLDRPARLVFMDDGARRPVDPAYAVAGDEVSFADGFPLLLLSQAALDALNARLATPVTMQRFRPNLVVSDTEPHAEDRWRRIRIGAVEFDVVKACTRCVFTTVDPATGERDPAGEPLRTLVGYRRSPGGVTFGQNLIPRGIGTVRVGDPVEVLEPA
ncbi:MOSC domain-containing protein [Chiayiivirga flava]|uniref:MOSC domain-containing protein n=1 Tax=Chiayiivirga flava TaxID=659595 RepID=A0A7W8D7U6_9GAMM|nr:MOSC N-terminal beta barrel domain-containing protein [Chiayiivirga flava]MBB5208261.1 hypothetical protein [Chiayiivirga flava]